MKNKFLTTITLCLLLSCASFAQGRFLKETDKIIGSWEMIEEGDYEGNEIGPCIFGGEDIGIKIFSFTDGNYSSMLASFKTEGGFACPCYTVITIDGNYMMGKAKGPCAVEDEKIAFKIIYKYDATKDQLIIVYQEKTFRYKRFTM